MFGRRRYKLKASKYQADFWKYKALSAKLRLRPSMCVPIIIKREGARWSCILDQDLQDADNMIAYGDSPEQACLNFDHLWYGSQILFQQTEEDEEEF